MLTYVCITEACGNPEPLNNGRVVISGRTPGSNATYLCDDHYQLIGNATVVCQLDSQWDGEVPKCKGTYIFVLISANFYMATLALKYSVGFC